MADFSQASRGDAGGTSQTTALDEVEPKVVMKKKKKKAGIKLKPLKMTDTAKST